MNDTAPTTPEALEPKLIMYRGRKYDIAGWSAKHPGGVIIEKFVGHDATVAMHMSHDMRSPITQKMLAKMDRGPAPEFPVSSFDEDYIALEQSFIDRGWFKVSVGYYVYRTVLLFALLATAFLVPGPWLKGLFFGLFVQQSAFIAHDVCHDAVVNKKWRRFTSWFYGTVCFGLNYEKWVREHNAHHMITNRPFEDPQMDVMPHLLYAFRDVERWEARKKRRVSDWEKFKMGFQHWWLMPVLLLYGRINIQKGDLKTAWRTKNMHFLSGHALHFVLWGLLLAQGYQNIWYHAPVFILMVLATSGLIHLQLILSHAYAPRLYEDEFRQHGMGIQAISNQNITTTFLDDWFHGGLQHHIEHHLFPRLPRHSLAKARPLVKAFCEQHGLPYRSDSFVVCVRDLWRSLYAQGASFREELAARKRVAKA